MSSKTPIRLAYTALAALAAVGVAGLTASPASASTVVNKPYKHVVTVETTNVRVFQHNWVRSDVTRTSGYLAQNYTYSDSHPGYSIRRTPFAENTGGELTVSDSDNFSDGSAPNTSVYNGSILVGVELDVTVDGPNAKFPAGFPDRNYASINIGPNGSTGWRHIKTTTRNGDFVEMDYRVTNQATPQF